MTVTLRTDMRNRIKHHQEIEKKESIEEKWKKELAKDLARADDDGFAITEKPQKKSPDIIPREN